MATISEIKNETKIPSVIADEQGLITNINQAFETVFGWQKNEILGKPLTIIIPKTLHDAHHLGFSRFITSGKPTLLNQALKLKAVTKDGTEFNAEHYIVAEKENDKWIFAATIRPLN